MNLQIRLPMFIEDCRFAINKRSTRICSSQRFKSCAWTVNMLNTMHAVVRLVNCAKRIENKKEAFYKSCYHIVALCVYLITASLWKFFRCVDRTKCWVIFRFIWPIFFFCISLSHYWSMFCNCHIRYVTIQWAYWLGATGLFCKYVVTLWLTNFYSGWTEYDFFIDQKSCLRTEKRLRGS